MPNNLGSKYMNKNRRRLKNGSKVIKKPYLMSIKGAIDKIETRVSE